MVGARAARASVEVLDLRRLAFSRDVETEKLDLQDTEPDIDRSRELVTWSDHLVFFYPTWWGTMPSLMKGFRAEIRPKAAKQMAGTGETGGTDVARRYAHCCRAAVVRAA